MNNSIRKITVETIYDEDPDTSYLEQDDFADRLEQYRNGDFAFVGVRAVAEVVVNGTIQTLYSGGLWGIEDDSAPDYFAEVASEELVDLSDTLAQLGFDPAQIEAAVAEARA